MNAANRDTSAPSGPEQAASQQAASQQRSAAEADPAPPEPDSAAPRKSLRPLTGADRAIRRRMGLKEELLLALLPTLTILIVLSLVEVLSGQRLLFASLASSAFLIYLDPQHGTNRVRTLLGAHLGCASIGVLMNLFLGASYPAAGAAMVLSIIMMITLDIVHPPAISTTLGFAFRSGEQKNLDLFLLAVLIVAILVLLQRAVLYILGRLTHAQESS